MFGACIYGGPCEKAKPCCDICSVAEEAVARKEKEEVWRFVSELGSMTEKELLDCYELDCVMDVLRVYSYHKAKRIFDAWKKERAEKHAALEKAMAKLHDTLREVHDARKALGLSCGKTFTINLDEALGK